MQWLSEMVGIPSSSQLLDNTKAWCLSTQRCCRQCADLWAGIVQEPSCMDCTNGKICSCLLCYTRTRVTTIPSSIWYLWLRRTTAEEDAVLRPRDSCFVPTSSYIPTCSTDPLADARRCN